MRKLPNGSRNYSAANKGRIRRLRREMSVSEKTLWSWIRADKLGFRFRFQYPIDRWVLDFYCPEAMLCIEVDGEQHALTQERDAIRDAELAELGVLTLRIPSLDLFTPTGAEFSNWIREIVRLCEERSGRIVWPNGISL
jgi:very-short-patch-repair endonuclease